MNNKTFIVVLVAVMVLLLFAFAIIKNRKQRELRKKYPGYPKGYWMGQGMAIGIAAGVGMGAALNKIAVGTALGVAIGAAIGSHLEKKHKDEIRPMTDEEKKLRRQSLIYISGIFLLVVALFILANFLSK